MIKKKSALDTEAIEYLAKLRENVVFAEVALMQSITVLKALQKRCTLPDDLRFNLEIQERALSDMLVMSLARLFDKKDGRRQDQLSLPNTVDHQGISVSDDQKTEISRLGNLPAVRTIIEIRKELVAHSLSYAEDHKLKLSDVGQIIDQCYSIIIEIHKDNGLADSVERKDISEFSAKWAEMTTSWCRS